MLEFLKKNNKFLFVGGVGLLVIGGGWFYLSSSAKAKDEVPDPLPNVKPVMKRAESTTIADFQSLVANLLVAIPKEHGETGHLSASTLLNINIAIALASIHEYRALVAESRSLRREVIDLNNDKYLELVIKFHMDHMNLIEKAKQRVYAKLNLVEENVTRSIFALVQEGHPQISFIENSSLIETIHRRRLRHQKEGLGLGDVKKCYKEFVAIFENQEIFLEEFKSSSKEEREKVLKLYAYDKIAIAHGIEDEDLINATFGVSCPDDAEYNDLLEKVDNPSKIHSVLSTVCLIEAIEHQDENYSLDF